MSRTPPRLMAISDRRLLGRDKLVDWAARLGRAGVDAVQLREKDLSDREIQELAAALRRALPSATRLLVNRRVDLALASGADGVHLPADGLAVAALRRRFGDRLLIGRSTHSPEEVAIAAREGADYVTFGPVYPTPSKARYGDPPGLAALRRAVDLGIPVLALGGVTIERLAETATAGASGIAAIRLFHEMNRLQQLIEEAERCFPRP